MAPVSLRDVLVLALSGAAVVATAAWAVRSQHRWGSRWTVQLVAGLVCGVAAAVAVAVPFVDVVPDAEEGIVAAGGAAALAVVGAGVWAVAGTRKRERGQVPRS